MRLRSIIRHLPSLLNAALHGQPGARVAPTAKLGGAGTIEIARGAVIGAGVRIWVGPGAKLTIGPGVRVGDRCILNVEVGVEIGGRSEISWDVQILDTDFHRIADASGTVHPHAARITIGEHVLIGARTTVLKGVEIGAGAVVGAASVVVKNVEPGATVAGNPARRIGTALGWGPRLGPEPRAAGPTIAHAASADSSRDR